jgi:hypothetical protein
MGWTVAGANVGEGGSIITLDHDRAGSGGLGIVLAESCDTGATTEIASQRPGVRQYEQQSEAASSRWYETFPGGCVTVELRAKSERPVNADLAGDVMHLVGFVSRAQLQGALAERSSGRLRLDATSGSEASGAEVIAPPVPVR